MIHENSIASFAELDIAPREREVLSAIEEIGHACTDRQVAKFMGSEDLNASRPRITALIAKGVLSEVGTYSCEVTGRSVRLVWIGDGTPKPPKGPTLMERLIAYYRTAERAREVSMFPDEEQGKMAEEINRLI